MPKKSSTSKLTLRNILVICFISISTIPVVFLAYWVQHTALEKEFQAVEEKHLIIAKNLTGAIERYINDAKSAFRVIISEHNNRQNHSNELHELLTKLNFQHIWQLKEKNQKVIFNRYRDTAKDASIPGDVFNFIHKNQSAPMKKNHIKLSGALNDFDEKPVIAMVLKVSNDEFVIGTITTEYILEVQSTIIFGDRGHAAIVDQYGKVLAHPVKSWHESMKDISFLPPVKNMMMGKTGVTQFYTPAMQADMIAGHTVVKNTGWGVMIPQPVIELHERARYAQFMALLLAFGGVGIAAFISWWLARYITRSLNNVTQFTETVASGEFDTHIPIDNGLVPIEISKLVSSFNRMIDKLKNKTEDFTLLNDRLREAQNIAKLGNWKLNTTDNTMWWSDEVYRILGLNKSNIASPTLEVMLAVIEEDQKNQFLTLLKKTILTKTPFSIDCKKLSTEGEIAYFHQDVVVQIDSKNEIHCLSGTIQDVTQQKINEEKLFFQARHDSLTKLPNRDFCLEEINNSLKNANENKTITAFFHVGLDHFKEVNGSLGHNIGDKLLILAGERIKSVLDSNDFVARLGSDEFGIVINSETNPEKIQKLASKIISEFHEPFKVENYEAKIGASVGICVYPDFDNLNPLSFLQKADTALHVVKANGRGGFSFYNIEMDESVITRLNLRSEISTALENDEFHLVFQPIVESKTGKVICAEALIRWIHPTRGFIPPDKFIPLAEESGYIADIGLWVIDNACKELKKWQENGYADLYISVNLSLRQIQLGLSKNDILDILHKYHLNPSFLTFEITESLLMEDLENSLAWLNDVRSTGIRFSIDDFGTGYSSLSYLLNLPVSTLKIDRAFISNILIGKKDETLIEMIIALSNKLGFKVVAEGVETQGQLDKLKEYNCDLIQGYFFSKPLKSDEFSEYIKKDLTRSNVTSFSIKKA